MKLLPYLAACAMLVFGSVVRGQAEQATPVDLSGQWRFQLDPADAGVHDRWFAQDLKDHIRLPGSLQEQGYGERPSAHTQWTTGIGAKLLSREKYFPYRTPNFQTPFWLTPDRHYVGVAWYQRDVDIPQSWAGQRVVLTLERPHWQTTLFLDDRQIGSNDSLGTPHEYDLSDAAIPGRHRLTVRVDNRVNIPVGLDAHSVSDQTQSNWNGIVGQLSLRAEPPVFVDDVQIYPDVKKHSVHVRLTLGNRTKRPGQAQLRVSAGDISPELTVPVKWDAAGGAAEFDYDLGAGAIPWSEFSPHIYTLSLHLAAPQPHHKSVRFGLREVSTAGPQLLLNNHPLQLRGTLECCIFPLTGYPPTDVPAWKRILTIARDHGLNHLRFHSWCPPEAAFVAGDEVGFYFQVEASCWARFGDGSPVDAWVDKEHGRMLRAYGNHPSFLLMAPSNEPSPRDRTEFLGKLIARWEHEDPRRLYTAGSGWPRTPQNQYDVESATRLHNSHELTRPPQSTSDYRDYVKAHPLPNIVHEMGQWCVYPNLDEIPKYTGHLHPGNLVIFKDFLEKSGMADQFHDFFTASGKFQTLLYKAEIEEVLRTPDMAGFQLLDLHDFPGQGTAPVGILDAFWDSKGYTSAEEFRRFCNQTVPLARFPKFVFTGDETASIQVDISHFGPTDLDAPITWTVRTAAGQVLASGRLDRVHCPAGSLTPAGEVKLPIAQAHAPAHLKLELSLDGTGFSNDWSFWVYPPAPQPALPPNLVVATDPDAALSAAQRGQTVLLLADPKRIAGNTVGAFEPIFWNRITFPNQPNHTLGILCDPSHPALAEFPTESHSDFQWWDLQQHCKPIILDALPKDLRPVVQMIDDWDLCRKLGLLVECKVGTGKLLICSIDLRTDMGHRPAARQFLQSVADYAAGAHCNPKVALTGEQVRGLFGKPSDK